MGNVPWVNRGQFSHACFSRCSLLDSQAFKCTACTCARSSYSTPWWRFKPSTLPVCSWVHSPTAFMSFCIFYDPRFLVFSLPAVMAPLYIRQYCFNYVFLSPVMQKTHCCCSFVLPVIFNSNLQTMQLKITVSSLLALCCWILLKAFETEKPHQFFFSSMIFSWFPGGILLCWWTRSFFTYPILPCTLCSIFFLILFPKCGHLGPLFAPKYMCFQQGLYFVSLLHSCFRASSDK